MEELEETTAAVANTQRAAPGAEGLAAAAVREEGVVVREAAVASTRQRVLVAAAEVAKAVGAGVVSVAREAAAEEEVGVASIPRAVPVAMAVAAAEAVLVGNGAVVVVVTAVMEVVENSHPGVLVGVEAAAGGSARVKLEETA